MDLGSTTTTLAAIAIVAAVLSAMLVSWRVNKAAAKARLVDYAKRDEVARQVVQAAKLAEVANESALRTGQLMLAKLDQIHGLVNSNMTSALQSELDSTIRELAGLQEIIDLKRVGGHEPNGEATAAIETTRARITELQNVLADRKITVVVVPPTAV